MVCGGVLVFTRRLQVGRQVELGELTGRVIGIRLLDVVLLASDGSEVRIPHLRMLFTPLRVLAAEPRHSVELLVSPELEPATVIALFTATLRASGSTEGQAAQRAGGEVQVELLDIHADGARYRASVSAQDPRSLSELRVLLVQALAREHMALGRASAQAAARAPGRAAHG
jgi:hypothetical protein